MDSRTIQDRESYERVISPLNMINNVTTALTQSFDVVKTLDEIYGKTLNDDQPEDVDIWIGVNYA